MRNITGEFGSQKILQPTRPPSLLYGTALQHRPVEPALGTDEGRSMEMKVKDYSFSDKGISPQTERPNSPLSVLRPI